LEDLFVLFKQQIQDSLEFSPNKNKMEARLSPLEQEMKLRNKKRRKRGEDES
jgi:hypothetical protein